MRQTRNTIAAAAISIIVASWGLSGIASAADTIKQAGFKTVDLAVPFLAKEKGFFAKNGLDWEYLEISSGKLGIAALLSGDVQFVDLGLDDVVALQAMGKDPIAIYSMVNSLTMDVVVGNDTMKTLGVTPASPLADRLKAFKGLTFGITRPGAWTQVFVQYLMGKVGLDPEKDATFVQIGGGTALVAAVKSGAIDGFMLSAPAPYILENDKSGTILIKNSAGEGPDELKNFAFESIATRKSYAENNPEIVIAFTRSLNQAYQWLIENRAEALEALKVYFPETDMGTLSLSVDSLIPAIMPGGTLSAEAIQNQLDVWVSFGYVESSPSSAEGVLWTNKYISK